MKKKALFIGINYPNTKHQLNGCVNDIKLTNEILTKKFGFTNVKHKRTLTDESATTENIIERLEWLVDDAQPGDVLFFHYSGHGSQLISTDYDIDAEPDGKDEIICPIDLNWRDKVIRDDDFKRIFKNIPNGVNLTILLDCCHSGSGIDSMSSYNPFGLTEQDIDNFNSPNKNRLWPMPYDIESRGIGLELKPKKVGMKDHDCCKGLLISGCQDNQVSADAWIHNKYQGAATYFLNHVLANENYSCSYKTLVYKMNENLRKYGYSQSPELGGDDKYYDKKFLESFV